MNSKPIKLNRWTLFWSFFQIGMFTLGGGYAMLPLIKREVVEKHHWLDDESFIDGLAASQSCPGPIAVNMSIYAGYQIDRWTGTLLAVLGTVLPSFLIILAIAMSFSEWSNNYWVQRAFNGLRPCVTALIAAPIAGIIKTSKVKWHQFWLPLTALVLIAWVGMSPVYLIIFTICLAWAKLLLAPLLRSKLR